MPSITRGDTVRHKVHIHRGLGKVMALGPTFLRCQAPKLHVAFERGGWLWCYADDLVPAPAAPAAPARPALSVVETGPQVA